LLFIGTGELKPFDYLNFLHKKTLGSSSLDQYYQSFELEASDMMEASVIVSGYRYKDVLYYHFVF
jgi:hypothetical protein